MWLGLFLTMPAFHSSQGYYMYIEASHMVYGQKAHLLSWPLRGVPGKHCLTFFYHMYGAGTGLLSVFLKTEEESKESLLWRRQGEQSISWLRALVEYSCRRQHQVSPEGWESTRETWTQAPGALISCYKREYFVPFQVRDKGRISWRVNIISLLLINS